MHIAYSEEERLIADQARDFVQAHASSAQLRALHQRFDPKLWRQMAELGWLGMLIPEAHGGLQLGATAISRVVEALGGGLFPGPFLPHLFACAALCIHSNDQQQATWLPQLAQGSCKAAWIPTDSEAETNGSGAAFQAVTSADGSLRLSGEKPLAVGIFSADVLVIAASQQVTSSAPQDAAAWAYYLVDADADGVKRTPLQSIERGFEQGTLRLDAVRLSPERRLNTAAEGSRCRAFVDLMLAFDALGGSERAMHMAVDYAKLRRAFGQPIGSFQAIKFKAADMLHAVESLRALCQWAAWVWDFPQQSPDADPLTAAAMSRATAIECYDLVVRHATQIHGAIATTAEHDMHLFARRSRMWAHAFGSQAHYQEVILRQAGF